MTLIGSASIQIRADDKYFEPDVRRAVSRLKNVAIQLKADVDISAASKKIRDLRYRITNKDAVLGVDADTKKAEAKLIRFMENYLENEVVFRASTDLRNVESEIDGVKDKAREDAIFEIEADIDSANRAMETVKAMVEDFKAEITADADTAGAEAQLNFAARNRRSKFSVDIDPDIEAGLRGAFNSLTGTLPFETVKGQIAGVAANFEALSVKAAVATTAIGSVGAALLTTSANAFSVADDILQVLNLLGFMPIALIAIKTTLKANEIAWKSFGDASMDNSDKANKALAELVPQAQRAALAMRDMRKELTEGVQKYFWDEMGDSFRDMLTSVFPPFNDGMMNIAQALGGVQKAAFDAFAAFGYAEEAGVQTSVIKGILDNVGAGLNGVETGVAGAVRGFMAFAEVGSTYLPRFGEYLGGLANRFGEFAETAKNNGDMERWMDTGIQRAQELGSIIKSTTGIFNGLAEAARASGAPGLTELADGFKNVASVINSEPFQTRLISLLEGARLGTDKLTEGFGKLASFVGQSSQALGIFLAQAGRIAGIGFESIIEFFNGTGLGSGLMDALYGFEDALLALKPGFSDLGSAIGNLGTIAGELFRNMAPGLNLLFDTIDKVISGLQQGVLDSMPIFNEFIQSILVVVSSAVVPLANAVGDLLTAFSNLPSGVQTVIMSLAALGGAALFLKSKFGESFGQLRKDIGDSETRIGAFAGTMRASGDEIRSGFRQAFAGLGGEAADASRYAADGMRQNFALAANSIPDGFKDAMGRVGGVVTSGLSGAGAAVSAFGQGMRTALVADSEIGNVRTGFSGLSTSIAGSMESARSSISNAFSKMGNIVAPVDGAIRNTASSISTMAGQMHGNLAPARSAFTALADHAATATTTAANRMGSGLGRATVGFTDALGGPWGLAIAGATALLGVYAAEQQKAKARVDELRDSLDQQTGAFTGSSKKILASDIIDYESGKSAWSEFWRFNSKTASESLDSIGLSIEEVTTKLTSGDGQKYADDWDAIGDAVRAGKDITDEMTAAVGLADGALDGLSPREVQAVENAIGQAAETSQKAQAEIKALAEATGTESVQAAQLSRNFDILANSTSSVSDMTGALKSNLDIFSGGMISAGTNSNNLAASVFSTEDSLKSLRDATANSVDENGKFSDSFKSMILSTEGGFSTATREGVQFRQTMETAADAVLTSGAAELKRLKDLGMELPQAQAGALAVMNEGAGQLRQSLVNMGIDVGVVDQLLSTLGIDEDQLDAAIQLDTGDAESKAQRLALMLSAISQGNYEIALVAMTDEAKAQIASAGEAGKVFAEGDYEGYLKLVDQSAITREEFLLGMSEAKNAADVEAVLTAAWPDKPVVDGAVADLKGFGDYNPAPVPLKTISEVGEGLAAANGSLIAQWGPTKKPAPVELTTLDKVMEGIAPAQAKLAEYSGPMAKPKPVDLLAVDLTAEPVTSAMGMVGGFFGRSRGGPIPLEALDKTTEPVAAATGSLDIFKNVAVPPVGLNATDNTAGAVGSATATTQGLQDVFRGLYATDQTAGGTFGAQGTMSSLQDVFRSLFANDSTGGGVGSAQGTMGTLSDVWRSLFATDQTAGATGGAQATMASLQDVWRQLQASNATMAPTAESQATMNTLSDVMRQLQATNATGGPTAGAQGTMNTLQDVMRNLNAQNQTGGPKAAAQGTMNTLQDVMRDLNARNNTGGAKGAAQGTIDGLQGKTVDLNANDRTGGAVASARAAISTVVGKTVDIISNFIKRGDNADGGIWMGGQRAFADGGILGGVNDQINNQVVKSFAKGGIENHTAQIARGAWPVRVWAEPETGGEAYIPLSPSKRKRSLEILKVVMAQFGLSEFAQFAQGGVMQGGTAYSTPSLVADRYSTGTSSQSQVVAVGGSAGPNIQLVVNPSEKMDEEQIGASAAKTLYWNYINR